MRACLYCALIAATFKGCGENPPGDPSRSISAAPNRFDPSRCGTLSGQVIWSGPLPHAEPLPGERLADGRTRALATRPNVPAVDPTSRGLAGAVVYLRGIDPTLARPWDHPPVAVELRDERAEIRQGDGPTSSVGFVRRGDAVTVVSRQSVAHALRARGAAFFTLTLPDPDRPRTRILDNCGLVELTSATGCLGMHAYLWVSDHPYLVRTDAAGRWSMPRVPAGAHEVVCWLPAWHVDRTERDRENGFVNRVYFAPAHEWTQNAAASSGENAGMNFTVGDPH